MHYWLALKDLLIKAQQLQELSSVTCVLLVCVVKPGEVRMPGMRE